MSARKDAERVVALVVAVEALAKGQNSTLGDLALHVFGWDMNRVYLAIDAAVQSGQIARGRGGAIKPAARKMKRRPDGTRPVAKAVRA